MADPVDFLPVARETLAAIRARLDAEANLGVSPESDAYLDTVEGGFWWDITQAIALEIERLWDFAASEVPAAAFVTYAWGEYLDEHGEVLLVPRKDEARATGEVTFTATASLVDPGNPGIGITQGAQLARPTTDPDEDPRTYEVTESGTIPASPDPVTATPSTTGGTLAASTYWYVVTAVNDDGETAGSTAVSAVTTGATSSVVVDWPEMTGATDYNVYRGSAATAGSQTFLVTTVAATTTYTDTGALAPAGATAPTASTATLTLPVQAVEAGISGNTAAASVTLLLTPVSGVSAVTNTLAITGGADVESDEDYRDRLLLEFAAQGAGTQADYERWALAYPGVGHVTVQPLYAGNGTVRVVVTDYENNPVSTIVKEGLQAQLDPFNGDTLTSGSHTLPQATITVNSTTGFRDTGRLRIDNQIVTYTAKTATTFTGAAGGTGVIADDTRVVQSAEGRGQAPIGAEVFVATPTAVDVDIAATIVFETGYSLDGLAGTIAARAELEAAVTTYLSQLPVGEDVVLNHVEARFFRVRGVYDVTGTELNGVAANFAITAEQVAQLAAVDLT